MNKLINKYFASENIAVVGASSNKGKFGYKVYHLLKSLGYNVFPVNNHIKELDGDTVYDSIEHIQEHIDAVSMIIPPSAAEQVLEQIHESKIPIVWFQPGAESYKLIRYCNTHNIDVIYQKCVLVEAE